MSYCKRSPQEELERRTPKFIINAFSLVVALAWNEAAKDFISHNFSQGLLGKYKFLYALTLTILLVGIIAVVYWLNHLYIKAKDKIEESFGFSNNRETNLRIIQQ